MAAIVNLLNNNVIAPGRCVRTMNASKLGTNELPEWRGAG